jgi:hypothetical protein
MLDFVEATRLQMGAVASNPDQIDDHHLVLNADRSPNLNDASLAIIPRQQCRKPWHSDPDDGWSAIVIKSERSYTATARLGLLHIMRDSR